VPRLSVFKSSRHIYAQVIDDLQSRTLVAASSLTPKAKEMIKDDKKDKLQVSAIVGELLGQLALSKGIKKVCFDRGGFPYHGRIKSFAEAARGAGLEF
jgi:large subunit ribosomal protein L18